MGMLWWLLLAALFAWQLMLGAWTVTQTSNAARTASRVSARDDGDPEKAARNALSGALRSGFVEDEFEPRRPGRHRRGEDPDHHPGPDRQGLRGRAHRDAPGRMSDGPA